MMLVGEKLYLYWSEIVRLFALPDDIRFYTLGHFYAPLIQAFKEWYLINECHAFCIKKGTKQADKEKTLGILLNNENIFLDMRVIDNRLDLYVNTIRIVLDTREWSYSDLKAAMILEKAFYQGDLTVFSVLSTVIPQPIFSKNLPVYIKHISSVIELDPSQLVKFDTDLLGVFVLLCIKNEDKASLSNFLTRMDNIGDNKYRNLHRQLSGDDLTYLKVIQYGLQNKLLS